MSLLVSLALCLPAAGALPAPVAVLPFKYLGDDRGLPRLQEALAATLIADLEATPDVRVVDWSALRAAIDFRDLYRRTEAYTDAEACAAGARVGAAAVVSGHYGAPGNEITLAARLLRVDGCALLASAEAAGPSTELHATRARLAAGLFGGRVAPLPLRAAAPTTEPADPERALGFLGLALAGSDKTRLGLLREGLERDPTSPYLAQALTALEARAAAQAAWAKLPAAEAEKHLRAALAQAKQRPHDQHEAVMELFGFLTDCGYHREVGVLAALLERAPFPAELEAELRGTALYWQFEAARERYQRAEALRLGERYVKEQGRHRLYHMVKRRLADLVDEGPSSTRRLEQARRKLADLDLRQRRLEARPCQILFNGYQYLRAVQECAAFVAAHRDAPDERLRELAYDAWWTWARALVESGEFAAARQTATELTRAAPEWARTRQLDLVMHHWPAE